MQKGTAADLAKVLSQSHQLVKQKLPKLYKLRLIEKINDLDDRRKKLYYITEKGST